MKSQKLKWFAFGVAVASTAFLLPRWFVPAPEKKYPYLSVSERPYEEDELERIEEIPSTSGELLRDCGAKEFFMKPSPSLHHVPYSLIKITPENDLAIHCVMERARTEGFPLYVQMLTDQQAQVF